MRRIDPEVLVKIVLGVVLAALGVKACQAWLDAEPNRSNEPLGQGRAAPPAAGELSLG